jgi:glycosyltransferase involved in cell wall biosynthesis
MNTTRGHLVLLVMNDLVTDSRVRRHALTAAEAGWRVSAVALRSSRRDADEKVSPSIRIARVGRVFLETRSYRAPNRLYHGLADRLRPRARGRGAAPPDTAARSRVKPYWRDLLEWHHIRAMGRLLERRIRDLRPDVILCNDLDTLAPGLRYGKRHGVRVVFDSHELWPEQSSSRTPWWVRRWSDVERRLAPDADARITVNPEIARILSERWGGKDVGVVRNALPIDAAPASPARRGGRADSLRVTYVGGIGQGRGLPELIEAFRRLPRGRVSLEVYGFGDAAPALRARVSAAGLEDRVTWRDPLPQDQLVARLGALDVGVIPYRPDTLNHRYCTPTKLYEYMAAGLALAVSDVPSLRAIVTGEGMGVVFDPYDAGSIASALERFLADPGFLDRCRTNAFAAFRERYNWEAQRERFLEAVGG